MTKDEALKMALEALQKIYIAPEHEEYIRVWWPACEQAITAIKEALAQPEQEPVAWRYKILDYFGRPVWTLKTPKTDIRVLESQPLYTTPPQRKPLTNGEIYTAYITATNQTLRAQDERLALAFARAIEAAHGIKDTT